MALFGGTALIVPTVIMSFLQDLNACLVTTSVAVLLFALLYVY